MGVYFGLLIVFLIAGGAMLASGCAMFQKRLVLDLGAAKTIAQKYKDLAGEKCWTHIEAEANQAGILDEDTEGVASAVEVARVIRLQIPGRRQEIMAACSEVIMDIMIELAKRARR